MKELLQDKLSDHLPYIGQLIFFLILILPNVLSLFSPIEFILIFVLEAVGFLPLIYKISRKYSYFAWILQFFVFSILSILFHFERTFNIKDPAPVLYWFFLIPVILITIVIFLYLIYKEKIVKPVIFSLASSTAFIVLLMILFISYEAVPAFQENDPGEFITGTEWKSMFKETIGVSKTIKATIEQCNFSIELERPILYMQSDTNESTTITINNNAGKEDNFIISSSSDTLYTNLNQTELVIPPYQSKKLNITINASANGKHEITIDARSKTNVNHQEKLTVVVSDNAISLSPYRYEADSSLYAMGIYKDYTITNKGKENDTIIVKILPNDKFRPYISSDSWDYATSSVSFNLSPLENITFRVNANFVQLVEGTHNLIIEAKSTVDPKIILNSTFSVSYEEQETIRISPDIKSTPYNGTAVYSIDLEKGATERLGIEISGPVGWNTILYTPQNITLLENYGIVNFTFNESSRNQVLYLGVSPENQINGTIGKFEIKIINWGTEPKFGIFTFIIGTIFTTLIAILIAAPIGIACSMFLAEYLPNKFRNILRPIYELLAGIPSVIYGLWGVITLGPFLSDTLYPFFTNTIGKVIPIFEPTIYIGRDVFTASIVLAIMILPIIITLSEDAIRSVRRDLKEGSLALGTTRWQTLTKMVLPQAKSGITASIILATGRAIGETMAVLMIMGLVVKVPGSLFDATSTMTGIIASTFNWAYDISRIRHAIFAISLILFIMVFILNIIIFKIEKGKSKKGKKSRFNFFKKEKNIKSWLFKKIDFKKKKQTFSSIHSDEKLKSKTADFLSEINQTASIKKAQLKEKLGLTMLISLSVLASFFLFFILSDVIVKGVPVFKLEYVLEIESMGGVHGGFLNAIIGSLYLVAISLLIATPLSLGAAIYIQEYAKKSNIFTRIIMFASDTLASTPSIVYGAFGFMFFIIVLGFRWSLLVGGITLGFMIIPLMLRSSIESIKTVGDDLREGSFALGATQWQTISNVVIPTAIVGIISGIILSVGRAIGESAAVLLTAGYAREVPTSLLDRAPSLPVMIYNYFEFAARTPSLMDKLYAVALVLIVIVLILNAIARLIGYRYSRMMKN